MSFFSNTSLFGKKLSIHPDEVEYHHCFKTGLIKYRERHDGLWLGHQHTFKSLKASIANGELTKLPNRVSIKLREDRLPHVVSFSGRETYLMFYPAHEAYKEWISERSNSNI